MLSELNAGLAAVMMEIEERVEEAKWVRMGLEEGVYEEGNYYQVDCL
jgi:hypothetical protein